MADHRELGGTEIGYLRGGAWAAAVAALAMLHARGLVIPGRRGQASRTGSCPREAEPLERALFATLYGSMSPRELAVHRRVRLASGDLRRSLVKRGLQRPLWRRLLIPAGLVVAVPVLLARLVAAGALSIPSGLAAIMVCVPAAAWFLPRRTLAGARLLRALRCKHADLAGPDATPTEIGVAVGLYGAPALLATMPDFARQSGLLDGGRSTPYLGDSSLTSSNYEWGSGYGTGGGFN